MNAFRLTAALLFLTLRALAQGVTVTYELIKKTADPEAPVVKYVLTDNGTLSRFLAQFPANFAKKIVGSKGTGLIKDKPASLCYFENGTNNTRFSVKDSLHNMKWQLTGKSQTILGYSCLSATTTFRGRTYTAYYTPKLPVSNGPWKLGGLPGLILEAKTDDGYTGWRATNVTPGPVPPIDVAEVKARDNLDWNTFVAKYKEAVQRHNKYMRSQGDIPDDEEVKVLITSLEIFYPELQTGEGLSY
ncbi:MAG: GLPGLI family protein [Janthinobacterium lividum]